MTSTSHAGLLVLVLSLVQLLGFAVFSKGFFPLQKHNDSFNVQKDIISEPAIDRLAFVVIDALRQ